MLTGSYDNPDPEWQKCGKGATYPHRRPSTNQVGLQQDRRVTFYSDWNNSQTCCWSLSTHCYGGPVTQTA